MPVPTPTAPFDLHDAINRVREIREEREAVPFNRATPLLDELLELADLALVLGPHAARLLAENENLTRLLKEHRC